jgi:hypothetical protein
LILSSSKMKKELMGLYHLEIHQCTSLLFLPLIKWSLPLDELHTLLKLRSSLVETTFLLSQGSSGQFIKCAHLFTSYIEGAKPFKYGRGQHLVTSISLPRNEIQHCSILARHHSCANKRVCCRNYAADTTMVSHLDSFH